jgi:hypothetical protein
MWPLIAGALRIAAPTIGRAAMGAAARTEGKVLSTQFGQHVAGAMAEGAAHGVADNLEQRNNNGE